MKLSQFILNLQQQLIECGDIEVVVSAGQHDPYEASADIYFAEEDECWHPRLMIVEGERFNPDKSETESN